MVNQNTIRKMKMGIGQQLSERDIIDCAISSFHFLLRDKSQKMQTYTAGELALAIQETYNLDNPKTKAIINILQKDKTRLFRVANW